MRRVAIAVVVAIAASISTTSSAPAGTVIGKLGGTPPELGVGLLVSAPGGPGSGGNDTYTADDPSAPRPVFVRAVPAEVGASGAGGLSNLCFTPKGPTGPEYPLGNGWIFNIELFATATGAYLATIRAVCQPLDPAAPDEVPPAPVVSQPPTIGDIWRAVALPTPPIGVSPAAKGVTGLPTWVWTNGALPVGVAVGLGGYTVTGTARVVGYGVFAGDAGWVRSSVAGGPGDPAFAHVYETVGTYRLGVATLWSADAVMTGPGLAIPITIDLGTAVVTNGRDYPVVQIRSRLLP
ncbi:MAG: hypothetical protein QOH10_597 [Actinomycetota bacterium]|nr:hypothetical protein [Actinomycetota bacterium]